MSHPRWLRGGFADERFGPAFLRFCEAFANRYPWIPGYTIFNEPFTTLFLAGSEGLFPPYLRGMDGFLRLARSLLPAISGASRMLAALLPDAQHLNVDTCERHSASAATGEAYADYANDRRFFVTDLLMGAHIDERRPFVEALLASGGADILECEAARIDVLGLDYYAHSQWQFSGDGIGAGSSPQPGRLDDLIVEYWERYQLPCMLGETNLRGKPSDRATWLKYTLEHCENAVRRGVPLTGYCWFPFVDSCDWVSLLRHADRQIDPVGVYWLDGTFERMPSSMSRSYVLAVAHGSEVLPAYRLHPPVADWLAGYLPQMQHWEWLDAPAEQPASNEPRPDEHIVLPAALEEPPPGPAYQP
jgi:beta-glucosidase/6-phospho-beta-glucosidase/beta-galactosidase